MRLAEGPRAPEKRRRKASRNGGRDGVPTTRAEGDAYFYYTLAFPSPYSIRFRHLLCASVSHIVGILAVVRVGTRVLELRELQEWRLEIGEREECLRYRGVCARGYGHVFLSYE